MNSDKQRSKNAGPDMSIPKMLQAGASAFGKKVWMRKKQGGLWREYSWQDGYEQVKHFSLGLVSLGFGRGQSLCIVGDSDPQWFWAEIAVQAAGGVVVGLNRDRQAGELRSLIRQLGIKFAICQDREQVDKLIGVKDDIPALIKVIYWNAKGMDQYHDQRLISFNEVLDLGQRYDASNQGAFENRLVQSRTTDTAIIQFSSVNGSTAQSTTLTHNHLLSANKAFCSAEPLESSDRWFSCSSPEGTVEQAALVGSLASGMTIEFPENRETAQQDLREVGSTLVCYPSSSWEGLASTVKDRLSKTTFVKRSISRLAAKVGSRTAEARINGTKPGVFLKAAGAIAEFVFFRPLKARIGLANTRRVYAFGSELTPGTLQELVKMGLNVREFDVSGETVMARHRNGGSQG